MGTKVTIAPLGSVENSSFITQLNAAIDTLSDEFDNVTYRDGSFNLTGNLDCNSKRIFNLPAPIGPTEPLRFQDVSGIQGAPAADPIFTVATGVAGTSVLISGTYPNKLLTIPRGDPGGSGSLPDGTYSDILVSGGGATLTVGSKKITTGKMFNFDAFSILGNDTGTATGPSYLSVSAVKTLLSLSNVTNTSDANKPISTAQQTALDLKSSLASPVFTGNPTVPTAAPGDNDLSAASTAFVTAAITADRVAATVQTIPVLAGSMVGRASGGAAAGTIETGTNKLNFLVLDFDDTVDEFAQFTVPMPKSWNEGTVTAQFIWRPFSGTAAQAVVWGIQGVAISHDDLIDAAFGTAVLVTSSLPATTDLVQSSFSGAITIGGSPANEDLVQFQVYRDADNGSDTLVGDARLIGIRLNYTATARDDS